MPPSPSEHPIEVPSDPTGVVYNKACNDEIEQSAVYDDVYFHAINEPSKAIVLTAQCDIQQTAECNYLLLARVATVQEIMFWWMQRKRYTEGEIDGSVPIDSTRKKRRELIKSFTRDYLSGRAYAFYYLPALDNVIEPSFVCFELTACVSVSELSKKNKIALLKSPFREAVPVKFASYAGRVGTPAYRDDYLKSVAEKCLLARDT